MRQQEGNSDQDLEVQLSQLDMILGRQVAVSYNRLLDGVGVREKRFWSHQGVAGWRYVHSQRTPATQC